MSAFLAKTKKIWGIQLVFLQTTYAITFQHWVMSPKGTWKLNVTNYSAFRTLQHRSVNWCSILHWLIFKADTLCHLIQLSKKWSFHGYNLTNTGCLKLHHRSLSDASQCLYWTYQWHHSSAVLFHVTIMIKIMKTIDFEVVFPFLGVWNLYYLIFAEVVSWISGMTLLWPCMRGIHTKHPFFNSKVFYGPP